jgi:hypothetical protein
MAARSSGLHGEIRHGTRGRPRDGREEAGAHREPDGAVGWAIGGAVTTNWSFSARRPRAKTMKLASLEVLLCFN